MRRGVLPIARRDLHDDVILVERVVDRRHLPLAEGVIKRVVDRAERQAEPLRRRAIDRHVGLEAGLLLVRIDVLEDVRLLQRLGQPRRPFVELGVSSESSVYW